MQGEPISSMLFVRFMNNVFYNLLSPFSPAGMLRSTCYYIDIIEISHVVSGEVQCKIVCKNCKISKSYFWHQKKVFSEANIKMLSEIISIGRLLVLYINFDADLISNTAILPYFGTPCIHTE